jgi:hypothetical protein
MQSMQKAMHCRRLSIIVSSPNTRIWSLYMNMIRQPELIRTQSWWNGGPGDDREGEIEQYTLRILLPVSVRPLELGPIALT